MQTHPLEIEYEDEIGIDNYNDNDDDYNENEYINDGDMEMDSELQIYKTSLGSKIWQRPPVVVFSGRFQQITIDWYMNNDRPIIRMYGVTADGNSILCHVHGFLPYMYFYCPQSFTENDIIPFKRWLNNRLENSGVTVELCEITKRKNIYGYAGDEMRRFIKISINNPWKMRELSDAIKNGRWIRGENERIIYHDGTLFESRLEFELRFMIDHDITGANWVELSPNSYRFRDNVVSHCQFELDVHHEDVKSYLSDDIAPLVVLSFDIECAGRKDIFPEPKEDPVIQVANTLKIHGEDIIRARNVFVLGDCDEIRDDDDDITIYTFKTEKELLLAWHDFIVKTDPDLLTGWNIANFDIWYLVERAKALGLEDFAYIGRTLKVPVRISEIMTTTRAFGKRKSKRIAITGRVVFDMFPIIFRNYKLSSYKLDAVAEHFLGLHKKDVHYSTITELFRGTKEQRAKLALYCYIDAKLPLQLMDKLMCIFNYIEMARVTGVSIQDLIVRGQQYKVMSGIYRKAKDMSYVIPVYDSTTADDKKQYKGALVIEPKKGFYEDPIVTLDFNSLYPSIIMAHNLCYTTLLTDNDIEKYNLVKDVDYEVKPGGHAFLLKGRHHGLLPTILGELIDARKKAKADLKKETDIFKKAVLDGRQLALKLSANSVYGLTGAGKGYLPCLAIASTVTAIGQQMIRIVKDKMEAMYTKENGYNHDCTIVYGDTDSVMIRFGESYDLKQSMELGKEAAEYINKLFIAPIKIEFEKAYCPYLLIAKKRYSGLYWSNPNTPDKIDTKGIEIVRRDTCLFVQNIMKSILEFIFKQRDVQGAVCFVHERISRLLNRQIDIDELVITKQWSKQVYKTPQIHVELAKTIAKRDPTIAPGLGERIKFIVKDSRLKTSFNKVTNGKFFN